MNHVKNIFTAICLVILSHTTFAQTSDAEVNFTNELNQFKQFANSQYQFPLHIVEYWSSDSKNMEATALVSDFQVVRVYGGVYRNLSLSGFRLALCHELGHKVGGEPYIQVNSSDVASTMNRVKLSAEGQADYFAPSCLKKYINYINETPSRTSSQYSSFCGADESCAYLIAASWNLAQMLAGLQNPKADLQLWPYQANFVAPNTLKTLHAYPSVQCRFQTYVAASLGQERPACWYNPNK